MDLTRDRTHHLSTTLEASMLPDTTSSRLYLCWRNTLVSYKVIWASYTSPLTPIEIFNFSSHRHWFYLKMLNRSNIFKWTNMVWLQSESYYAKNILFGIISTKWCMIVCLFTPTIEDTKWVFRRRKWRRTDNIMEKRKWSFLKCVVGTKFDIYIGSCDLTKIGLRN